MRFAFVSQHALTQSQISIAEAMGHTIEAVGDRDAFAFPAQELLDAGYDGVVVVHPAAALIAREAGLSVGVFNNIKRASVGEMRLPLRDSNLPATGIYEKMRNAVLYHLRGNRESWINDCRSLATKKVRMDREAVCEKITTVYTSYPERIRLLPDGFIPPRDRFTDFRSDSDIDGDMSLIPARESKDQLFYRVEVQQPRHGARCIKTLFGSEHAPGHECWPQKFTYVDPPEVLEVKWSQPFLVVTPPLPDSNFTKDDIWRISAYALVPPDHGDPSVPVFEPHYTRVERDALNIPW